MEQPDNEQETFDTQPNESSAEELTSTGRDRRSIIWKSCLLLFALSLSLIATPLAILYRMRSQENERSQFINAIEKRHAAIDGQGRGGRIAYINGERQLATIAPDGTESRQLTDSSLRFQFPAWSPDGSSLAVIGGDGLYVISDHISAATNELKTLYEDPVEAPFYHYWAPDSQRLSFLANHPQGIALHLVDVVAGEESERLLLIGQPLYWDWMPSGERILTNTGIGGLGGRVSLIDPAGLQADREIAESGLFQAPGFSWSGHYRSYASMGDDDLSHLVIQDDEGQIIFDERHMGQIAVNWSPTADRLAFTVPEFESFGSQGPLRILDPISGEDRILTQATVLAFFWAPDGEKIAYLALPHRDNDSVQAISFKPDSMSNPGTLDRVQNIGIELWVVNVDTGFQRQLITFQPSDVFIHQFLPFFDQYALSHRLWSPESDALVFPVVENGTSHIVVVDVADGERQILDDGQIGFWSP